MLVLVDMVSEMAVNMLPMVNSVTAVSNMVFIIVADVFFFTNVSMIILNELRVISLKSGPVVLKVKMVIVVNSVLVDSMFVNVNSVNPSVDLLSMRVNPVEFVIV